MGGVAQVGAGESLLIVGPSGCGKSSLLRAIAGTPFLCMLHVHMRMSPPAPRALFCRLATSPLWRAACLT